MKYADPTLGLSAQSLAILALLADADACPDEDGNADTGVLIETHAWYNGRENGVSLTVRASPASERALVVTFCEHRRSDEITVDSCVVPYRQLGDIPTPEDMRGASDARFHHLRVDLAYRHITNEIDAHVADERRRTRSRRVKS